jgi:hypothetical protein
MPDIDGGETPDEEILAFEKDIVRRVTAGITAGLDDLIQAILAAFQAARIAAGGQLTPQAALSIGRGLAARIESITWTPMAPLLTAAAIEARDLGVRRAMSRLTEKERDSMRQGPNWRRRIRGRVPVPEADDVLRIHLRDAAKLARGGVRTAGQLGSVAGKLKSARARVQGHARLAAHEGVNAGVSEVARTMGMRLIWVAERNACLDCLAHAGYAVSPGDYFPGVSFDPLAESNDVQHPPLHPNCRCEVRTYDGPAGPPDLNRSTVDPAARLAAEARRSVVYQWTEYESGPAARRAAEALLAAGAGLPASVEKQARKALKRGGVERPA